MAFYLLRKKDTRDAWVTKDGFTDDPFASDVKDFDTVAKTIEYAFAWKGKIISQLEVAKVEVSSENDIETATLASSLVTAIFSHGKSTSTDETKAKRSAKSKNSKELNGKQLSFKYACERISDDGYGSASTRDRDRTYSDHENLLDALREMVEVVQQDEFRFKGYRHSPHSNPKWTACEMSNIIDRDRRNSFGHGQRRNKTLEVIDSILHKIEDMPREQRVTKGAKIVEMLADAFEKDIARAWEKGANAERDELLQSKVEEIKAVYAEYIAEAKKEEPTFSFKNLYVIDTFDLSGLVAFDRKRI